jgi:hypothetical protein
MVPCAFPGVFGARGAVHGYVFVRTIPVKYCFRVFIPAFCASVFMFLSALFARFFRMRLDFFFFSSILFYLSARF